MPGWGGDVDQKYVRESKSRDGEIRRRFDQRLWLAAASSTREGRADEEGAEGQTGLFKDQTESALGLRQAKCKVRKFRGRCKALPLHARGSAWDEFSTPESMPLGRAGGIG
jgi:hypothetical protein